MAKFNNAWGLFQNNNFARLPALTAIHFNSWSNISGPIWQERFVASKNRSGSPLGYKRS